LAAEAGVLALPGAFFGPGQDDHLRMAFANVDEAVLSSVGDRLAVVA
jgi:aspartate/methionine/tyrosine aminotransferase